MPRAFTAVEKETIRDKLMEAGRSCFLRYGPRKTTIDDLVRPAGIAKASFYLFFQSKEELYVELMLAEIPSMMERLLDASFHKTDNTHEALILLMKAIVHEIQTNELARILLDDPQEMMRLAAGMDFERILGQAGSMFQPLLQEIAQAQERGEIVAGDPLHISYALGLVKILVIQRDRVPQPLFDIMLDFAPQVIQRAKPRQP
ncbi:TetR/AcrR family transcriptional regulator [Candidatus Bipolaricaulota bacterium]